MRVKLTDAAIKSYKAGVKKYSKGDAACVGLSIRVTTNGIKSFVFSYRSKVTGKVEHLTLGRYPDVSLDAARKTADAARVTVAAGGTPLAPAAQRAADEKKESGWYNALC